MWYQNFVPYPYIIVPIMIITTTCHTPKNNTDVIITYSNHADAERDNMILKEVEKTTEKSTTEKASNNRRSHFDTPVNIVSAKHAEIERYEEVTATTTTTTTEATTENEGMSSDEGVVFIPNEPNERKIIRNDEFLQPQPKPLLISDILKNQQTIKDVLAAKEIKLETENPFIKEDIIFVSGKNKIVEEKKVEKEKKKKKHSLHEETELTDTESVKEKAIVPKLDCKHLNCNNSIVSVCGAKLERNQWKYRLFLNECFFRKVNCYFRKKENRYKQVKLEYCKTIAVHLSERPPIRKDRRRQMPEPVVQIDDARRANARRSSTLNINGQLCDHPCPSFCPENYDPECAISEDGHKKVFVNHCNMDLNSCTFGIVWQRRPLADCVGGKKADMQQNRGFIHWMQSVGIVDKKGRLSLD